MGNISNFLIFARIGKDLKGLQNVNMFFSDSGGHNPDSDRFLIADQERFRTGNSPLLKIKSH